MNDIRQTVRVTALYERLSHDEETQGESNSIVNQKAMLEKYAQQNGFANLRHYTEDGISGGTFERPGWKRLLSDVEAGLVGCVLVKDMSRIGRDYLQVGYYTEVYFREKGVRFIAVANSIDSAQQETGEFAPFLNVMSEYYLHDLSRKIRDSVSVKAQAGKHLSNRCPYGYRKSEEDKDQWVIDEEAAAVVREIYQMALDGLTSTAIAKRLADEQIPTPTFYRCLRSSRPGEPPKNPYRWSSKTVEDILSAPDYNGWTVNRKRQSASYKDSQRRTGPEDWQIIKGTQEAIVPESMWNRVQEVRRETRHVSPRRFTEPHPLEGVVYCADCGARMFHKREHQTGKHPKECFLCSAHVNAAQRGEQQCSRHYTRTSDLSVLVLDTLRMVCGLALSDENRFLEAVQKTPDGLNGQDRRTLRERIRQNQRRCAELDRAIQALFEGNILGTVTDAEFAQRSGRYEAEQSRLETETAAMEKLLNGWDSLKRDAKQFVNLARRVLDFSTLTAELVNTFLNRILVHEAELVNGERVQEVEICFNFIGRIDPPQGGVRT